MPEYVKTMQVNMALAHRHVTGRIEAAADARDRMNDALLHAVSYRVGDEVYAFQLPKSDGKNDITQKLVSPYQGPYRILKALNDVTYQVEHIETRKKKMVHVTKIKKVHKRPQHLMPHKGQEKIPILEGALDQRNQQQGDQYQSHGTRRQKAREARERGIQQAMQLQAERDEKKYDPSHHAQGTAEGPAPTSADAPVSASADMGQEEEEVEEGEVILPARK